MIDYYKVLGVKQTTTTDEIKSAYLKLIKNYHPDIYKGDKSFAQQKTSEITQAYTILKDETSRKKYDDKYNINKTPNKEKKNKPHVNKEKNVNKKTNEQNKFKTKSKKEKTKKENTIKKPKQTKTVKTESEQKTKAPSYYYDIAIWGLVLLVVVIILVFIIT